MERPQACPRGQSPHPLQMIEVAAHKFASQGKSRVWERRAQFTTLEVVPLWWLSHRHCSGSLPRSAPPSLSFHTPVPDWHMLRAGLSLSITNGVAGPALVVLIVMARCLCTITTWKLWKSKGLLFTVPGNYTAHLGLHQKVPGRKRERVCVRACDSAFTGVKREGLTFGGLILYWWI